MLIGVPKEIKSDEYRIGLTPESVEKLTQSGHEVMIEQNAGLGIGRTIKLTKMQVLRLFRQEKKFFKEQK
ncbi:MAG: hypothetical protein Ct9H90mP13_08180 [Pseudomonadota bacterium]|nr:MAG: hypothetical protein Ct9H90mP13_08180 [Pseudomonadota bacterium]